MPAYLDLAIGNKAWHSEVPTLMEGGMDGMTGQGQKKCWKMMFQCHVDIFSAERWKQARSRIGIGSTRREGFRRSENVNLEAAFHGFDARTAQRLNASRVKSSMDDEEVRGHVVALRRLLTVAQAAQASPARRSAAPRRFGDASALTAPWPRAMARDGQGALEALFGRRVELDVARCTVIQAGLAWPDVLQLLARMRRRRLRPDRICLSRATRRFAAYGQWLLAMQFLQDPDVISYNCAISACPTVLPACRVLRHLPRASLRASAVTLAAAAADPAAGRWAWALQFSKSSAVAANSCIRACKSNWRVALCLFASANCDVITYSSVTSACSWHLAADFLMAMGHDQVLPNVISYNSAIDVGEKAGRWQRAVALLEQIVQSDLLPSTVSCNSAIRSCAAAGNLEVAQQLLCAMPAWRLTPEVISFNSVIAVCERRGNWATALSIFQEMKDARLAPDVISCSSLISCCESAAQWTVALELLTAMEHWTVSPDVFSYNCAISACDKGGQLGMAMALLQQMTGSRVQRDVVSFNSAISAAGKDGKWRVALSLLQDMEDLDLRCTVVSLNSALNTCPWQLGLALLATMTFGMCPDVITFSSVILACQQALAWLPALTLLHTMRSLRVEANVVTYQAAVAACDGGGSLPAQPLLHDTQVLGLRLLRSADAR
ncbi:unnamed protein product [Effrenium voratum]|nr:unnamed protein product [Effrenium voratum]